MKWTKEQENVIKKRGGNLLVSAAAGSGKTAVLVQRIIEMIMDKERPVDIDKLLVVTFTKAAAAQMKERIQEAIERELKKNPANDHLIRQMSLIHKAQITTIHSFCLSVIRSHFHQVDLEPDFRMGDETEVELLKMEVVEEVFSEYYEKQDKGFLTLVESYGTLKSDKAVEDMVLTLYESAMSHMNPLQWLQEVKESFLVSSVSELREQPFMQYAYKECKELLLELEEYLEIAKEICNEPGGPTPYESVLKDDIAILRTVRGGNNLDEMKQALQEKKYTRIPKVDKTQVLEHKQNMVKEMREVYKKQLKQLEEGLLRYSEEEILMQIQNIREIAKTLVELTCKLYEGYKEKKKEGNLLDFGDLEHLAYEIVSKEGVAKEYQDYFYEIMIDEYQDSNFLQEGILKAISKEKIGQPNRFMVGDVKQSIYKFRMAKPEIFIEKYHTYEADLEAKATLIELNNNFRSRMSLLSGVNEIFEKIMRKELGNIDYDDRNSLKTGGIFPETDKLVGGDTELLLLDLSEEENRAEDEMLLEYSKKELEAQNVAERIKELVEGEQPQYVYDKKLGDYRKANYGDIVILLRAVSEWADVFSEVLLRNNIPAHTESKKGYFDTLEIKNILSMLTVIDNVYLDIPLVAVMRSKFGEFKGEELAAIKVFQKEEGYEELYFYDVLQLYVEKKENPLQKKIAAFLSQLEYFREIKHHYSIRELMEVILDRTNYLYFVSAMPQGEKRVANIKMLMEKAENFEQTSYSGLFQFVRYIEKMQKYDVDYGEVNVTGEQEQLVRIMTIHQSKGLEFPICFVCGLEKKFNRMDEYKKMVLDSDLYMGLDCIYLEDRRKETTYMKKVIQRKNFLEMLGEELRVLYVALTRGMEKLILSGTVSKGLVFLEKFLYLRGNGEKKIQYFQLTKANSYLDFICMAVMTHNGFDSLLSKDYVLSEEKNTSHITVNLTTPRELMVSQVGEELKKQEKISELLQYNPKVANEEREQLKEILNWTYSHQEEVEAKGKYSVTEVKVSSHYEEEAPLIPSLPSQPNQEKEERVPSFLVEAKEISPANRGTIVHKVMELLPFTRITSEAEVEDFLQALVSDKVLEEEGKKVISSKEIYGFCASKLGQRVMEAEVKGQVYRERQFVMGVPLSFIHPNQSSDETVLLQGIIDLYFQEEDGIVLVDYKTDRVKKGQEDVLIQRYKTQLLCYKKAIEQLTNQRVKEIYIYSFSLNKEILLKTE